MENNLTNKSAFFAQYWGQKILVSSLFAGYDPYKVDGYIEEVLELKELKILLKPLSAISDEDCEAISKLTEAWDGDILPAEDVEEWLEEILTGNCALSADYVSGYQAMEIVDYLRSKGYALPYMNLSVQQLEEYGWIKLTDNKE